MIELDEIVIDNQCNYILMSLMTLVITLFLVACMENSSRIDSVQVLRLSVAQSSSLVFGGKCTTQPITR